ncbi:MAG: IPExxxVDY family protein [Capnocytophaga sp.]|nr:IPExxxVDY family protein [Capnocytophaga sp.]
MGTFQLDDADSDSEHLLIAIHTSLEDYRLAYFLNLHLQLRLHKTDDWISNKIPYSCYQYTDEPEVEWFCIANKNVRHADDVQQLFATAETNYLINEHKKVDYWLKATYEYSLPNAIEMCAVIKNIPLVIMTYSVDFQKLKSKNKLIF